MKTDNELRLDMGDDADASTTSLDLSEPDIDSAPLIDDEISAKDLQLVLRDGLDSYAKYLRSKNIRVPQISAFVSGKEYVDVDGMRRDLLLTEEEIARLEPAHERMLVQKRSAYDMEQGAVDARHRDAMNTRDGVSYQRSMATYEKNLQRLRREGVPDPTNGEFTKTANRLLELRKNRLNLLHVIDDAQRFAGYLEVAQNRQSTKHTEQRIAAPQKSTMNRVAELFRSWKM